MNKTPAELRQIIGRIRPHTRNTDVLDLCDALEALLVTHVVTTPTVVTRKVTPKRDRAAYMRWYRATQK